MGREEGHLPSWGQEESPLITPASLPLPPREPRNHLSRVPLRLCPMPWDSLQLSRSGFTAENFGAKRRERFSPSNLQILAWFSSSLSSEKEGAKSRSNLRPTDVGNSRAQWGLGAHPSPKRSHPAPGNSWVKPSHPRKGHPCVGMPHSWCLSLLLSVSLIVV